ncbi:hypothetical protein M0Q28_06450 [Patescibacteria group bacterium]|jgi:hypothetical protein|nr:hypothetical protein [Patescibacteria group bacterium]
MRTPEEFAKLLVGMEREINFTHVRMHGCMTTQFLDELSDSIYSHFKDQIKIRDQEILETAKNAGWKWIKENCDNTVLLGDSFESAIDSALLEPPKD